MKRTPGNIVWLIALLLVAQVIHPGSPAQAYVSYSSDLTATKTNNTDDGIVDVDEMFVWQIVIKNEATEVTPTANAVFGFEETIFVDNLPGDPSIYNNLGKVLSAGVTGDVSCNIIAGDLTCTADDEVTIEPQATITLTFDVTPNSVGPLNNPQNDGICMVDPNNEVDEFEDVDFELNNDCNRNRCRSWENQT